MKILSQLEKRKLLNDAIRRINSGEVIEVADSSSSSIGVCIGDFRSIGWSERCTSRDSLWYEWNGPVAIIVGGDMVEPHSSTIRADMDWS